MKKLEQKGVLNKNCKIYLNKIKKSLIEIINLNFQLIMIQRQIQKKYLGFHYLKD